jgi:hypothetical protein
VLKANLINRSIGLLAVLHIRAQIDDRLYVVRACVSPESFVVNRRTALGGNWGWANTHGEEIQSASRAAMSIITLAKNYKTSMKRPSPKPRDIDEASRDSICSRKAND